MRLKQSTGKAPQGLKGRTKMVIWLYPDRATWSSARPSPSGNRRPKFRGWRASPWNIIRPRTTVVLGTNWHVGVHLSCLNVRATEACRQHVNDTWLTVR